MPARDEEESDDEIYTSEDTDSGDGGSSQAEESSSEEPDELGMSIYDYMQLSRGEQSQRIVRAYGLSAIADAVNALRQSGRFVDLPPFMQQKRRSSTNEDDNDDSKRPKSGS